MIMTGSRLNYGTHCKVKYRKYVQIHKKHNNSMVPRTLGSTALKPSGNKQGGNYFCSLNTGK